MSDKVTRNELLHPSELGQSIDEAFSFYLSKKKKCCKKYKTKGISCKKCPKFD